MIRLLPIWMFSLGLALVNLSPATAFANDAHGTLQVVKGQVEVLSAKTGKVIKAAVGDKVFPKDQIITHKDSRAKVVMSDKNELHISPETKLIIQHYENNAQTGKKKVDLSLLQGQIRSSVKEKYDGKDNTYQVKTPTAVAGVRGTDFLTGYDARSRASRIVTFSGRVEAGMIAPNGRIAGSVMVDRGKSTMIAAGAAPTPPAEVPQEELSVIAQDSSAATEDIDGGRLPTTESAPTDDSAPEADAAPTDGAQASEPGPSDTASGGQESSPASRETASTPSVSMIEAEDVSADIGNNISVNPESSPAMTRELGSVQPPAMQQPNTTDFVDERIRNLRSKVEIIVNGP